MFGGLLGTASVVELELGSSESEVDRGMGGLSFTVMAGADEPIAESKRVFVKESDMIGVYVV